MIKVDEDIREYETKTTDGYTNIEYLVEQQCKSGTGLIYTGHIRTMKKLNNMLTEKGIPSIAIWSITNADNPMNEEQLAAGQHILDKEELPPQYKAVIINASCETFINIKSKVDYMVIHTVEEEVQIQVRGRCRNDLDRLYVLSHDALIVPPEYLDRKLFAADKSKLCDILLAGFCVALCIAMSLLGLRTIVAQWYQYLGYIGMTLCIVPLVIIWPVLRSRGVVPRVYKKK